MLPMPENAADRTIHTLSPLGAVCGLLTSISLSNRYMKSEIKEMAKTYKMVLPLNVVAQEDNIIQFGEQDKAGVIYPTGSARNQG